MIGFQDESSPQTTASTVRLWCPTKPTVVRNTGKVKTNAFGSYAANGTSVVEFPESARADGMCTLLEFVRRWNGDRLVVMVLDNCRVHHSRAVVERAAGLGIALVFNAPYSLDLNPIEFIWKTLKRTVFRTFLVDCDHMACVLSDAFATEASKPSTYSTGPSKIYAELVELIR